MLALFLETTATGAQTPSVTVAENFVYQNDTVHLVFTGVAPFELDYTFNGTRQKITVSGASTTLAATQVGENLLVIHKLIDRNACFSEEVPDDGVDIGGVIWATRNVDAPGTFTATPEDAGMFYQWGKNTGWSTANPMINSNGDTEWDWNYPPNTGKWDAENDPCPCGWRVPTKEEQWEMIGEGSADIIQNGVKGRLSRTDRNTVFLPYASTADGRIAGWRNEDGSLQIFATEAEADALGPHHSDYWSGTQSDKFNAYDLCFRHCVIPGCSEGYPKQELADKKFAPLLRCVKDTTRRCPQIIMITATPNPVKIPNGFSPNGDGINDYFEIISIENYPNNSIVIFNRWGNKVFEAAPYRNDWDGRTRTGSSLPAGTYFYIFDLGDGSSVKKGFVYLNK